MRLLQFCNLNELAHFLFLLHIIIQMLLVYLGIIQRRLQLKKMEIGLLIRCAVCSQTSGTRRLRVPVRNYKSKQA